MAHVSKFRDHTMSISQKTLRMEKGYSVDFISYFMVVQTKTYPALYQQHLNLFVIDLSPKSLFWTSKQPFAKSSWKPLRVVVSYAYLSGYVNTETILHFFNITQQCSRSKSFYFFCKMYCELRALVPMT